MALSLGQTKLNQTKWHLVWARQNYTKLNEILIIRYLTKPNAFSLGHYRTNPSVHVAWVKISSFLLINFDQYVLSVQSKSIHKICFGFEGSYFGCFSTI